LDIVGGKSSGRRKAAILMVAMGVEASSQIMKSLTDDEVELLTREIADLGQVSSDVIEKTTDEFREMVVAHEYMAVGGMDYAMSLLEEALGHSKALDIIKKVQRSLEMQGFKALKKLDPEQLLTFIQKEHPQTIALVLTQLEAQQSAWLLNNLPDDIRNDVIFRFATMERVSFEMIKEVERDLESRIDVGASGSEIGGVQSTAEVLNWVGTSVEKSVLRELAERNPELAEEIKNLMFVFDDIIHMDDRSIQRILREVRIQELALALKSTSPDVKKRVLDNMSERAQTMVDEEIKYMGPVKLSDVEGAQQRIVDVIRKLEEDGEIVIAGPGGQEEIIV
jgi:flagellar motor switch protein FliG